MKVLVTGAAGFIGMHVSAALAARGDEVVGIDNLNAYYDPKLKQARLAELIEDARYAPYLERQAAEQEAMARSDATPIGAALNYAAIPGLSNEMVERLSLARPATVGDAGRVRGITPAALTAIMLHVRRAA